MAMATWIVCWITVILRFCLDDEQGEEVGAAWDESRLSWVVQGDPCVRTSASIDQVLVTEIAWKLFVEMWSGPEVFENKISGKLLFLELYNVPVILYVASYVILIIFTLLNIFVVRTILRPRCKDKQQANDVKQFMILT